MYVVTVEFEIQTENVAEFCEAILLQASNSLTRETGCRQFDVCFDPERDTRCFLYEKYDDRVAFDDHLASDHFKEFDMRIASWVVNKSVATWQQNY